jgi:NAD(P)-dependent dehydrogenase (short-subunit alcohol dehydrogenase family)
MTGRPVVLVTGAAGGIGRATCVRFAAGGWSVVAVDRDAAGLATLDPAPVAHLVADLTSVEACRRAVAEAVAAAGRLDALVNAAGVWVEGPADLTTEDEWDRCVGVNLKGLYFATSAAIPHLEASGGSVVNLSSDAGVQGNAGAAVYCASKGGVSNLTRALALELAPRGVRVNAVCPGDVDTPMLAFQAETYGADDPQAYRDRLLAAYPQGAGRARFVTADEVAELVWFLAQPAAAAITGANVSIDLGLSAGI